MTALSIGTFRANIWIIGVFLFAISLQVLTTIKLGGTSLRISSSDLLLPVLALMLYIKWTREGAPQPKWRIQNFWGWLAILTLWMGVSLLIGRLNSENWQTWALFNKGIGWLILLAYLLVGGWMGAFREARIRDAFLRSMMLFAWVMCACLLVLYSLALYNLIPSASQSFYYPRIAGFFANPNAFGIAMATMAALFAPFLARGILFSPRVSYIGMTLLCAAVFLSVSRSAWLGLLLAALAFVITKVLHWRDLIRVAVVSTALVLAALHGPGVVDDAIVFVHRTATSISLRTQDDAPITSSMRPRLTRMKAYLDSALEQPANPGIEERLASMHAALEAWREAPIMGIGIGTYYQAHRDLPNVADTIHNTFLWLLTETGIIGAGLFTGFFVVVSLALLRGARAPPAGDPFLWGMLGVLLVFAGASVGTEILYQRYFWFLLGLALAVPYRPGREPGATDAAPRR